MHTFSKKISEPSQNPEGQKTPLCVNQSQWRPANRVKVIFCITIEFHTKFFYSFRLGGFKFLSSCKENPFALRNWNFVMFATVLFPLPIQINPVHISIFYLFEIEFQYFCKPVAEMIISFIMCVCPPYVSERIFVMFYVSNF